MTPESRQKLRALLLAHESFRQYPYTDTTGHLTIGIGRNLTDKGISETEAFELLDNDILYFSSKLSQVCPYFDGLDEPRQIALIDMCFNLGVNGFLAFHAMHEALAKKDYITAASAMLDSKWATQVGHRATDLSSIIKTGSLP